MVQYLVTYSIMSGRESDHDNWLRDVGIPFFQRQPGFQEIKSYSTLVGSGPDWVLEINFDSPENLMKALDSDEATRLLEDFEHLVTNLSTKILTPIELRVPQRA
jgi:antibiotic biosynthesis monooxygenase (ABM) superfamily enzyme